MLVEFCIGVFLENHSGIEFISQQGIQKIKDMVNRNCSLSSFI